jgi:hypothetical protein
VRFGGRIVASSFGRTREVFHVIPGEQAQVSPPDSRPAWQSRERSTERTV